MEQTGQRRSRADHCGRALSCWEDSLAELLRLTLRRDAGRGPVLVLSGRGTLQDTDHPCPDGSTGHFGQGLHRHMHTINPPQC